MSAKNRTTVSTIDREQSSTGQVEALLPIYTALASRMELSVPFTPEERSGNIAPQNIEQVEAWFDAMDGQIQIPALRQLLQTSVLGSDETRLRALIHRHLYKPSKTSIDRDKIDFLLVQYLALCAPPSTYHKQIDLKDVASVMEPVLGKTEPTALSWCQPLEQMIVTMREFRSLDQMLATDFIEQGRKIKESAGGMFYDPASLLAFVRFSFLVRRTLIELMHEDLAKIRSGLIHLEEASVKTLDCRKVGLSGEEPLAKVKELADEWKQPFQREYTERTVNQMFERLLSLRAAVEEAVNETRNTANVTGKKQVGVQDQAPSVGTEENPATLDFDRCLEQILAQLNSPPTRGSFVTTVKIRDAKVSIASWELTAFTSENSAMAEDLRRAVIARAIVNAAVEDTRKLGPGGHLKHAVSLARIEVSRLQERVEMAKQANDAEAAVNLGISTKRLLGALDEAQKLSN